METNLTTEQLHETHQFLSILHNQFHSGTLRVDKDTIERLDILLNEILEIINNEN